MGVSYDGDVRPVSASGFPFVDALDADQDGSTDYLVAGGDGIITTGISQTDPTGTTGGLPWDAVQVWRSYDSPYPVIVGYDQHGVLTINGNASLRWTHLSIGDTVDGVGEVEITGFGSLFQSDRDQLSQDHRRALSLANGKDIDAIVYNDLFGDTSDNPFTNWLPQLAGNYNCWVGRRGYGKLGIYSGARCVVRHRLFVACRETAEDTLTASPLSHADDAVDALLDVATVGDLATLEGAVGGELRIDSGAELVVTGVTADDRDPLSPPGIGSQDAQIGVAALPSVFGETAVVRLAGRLAPHGGLINQGTIVVPEAADGTLLVATKHLTNGADEPYDHAGTLTNSGLIVVKRDASLFVPSPLVNDGLIYLESGARLIVPQGVTGDGVIERSPCCPAAILVDEDGAKPAVECSVAF